MLTAPDVLSTTDLVVSFPHGRVWRPVVDRVSLRVRPGERVGLVGESGSGKSVTALSALGLVPPPGAIRGGRIEVAGRDLASLGKEALRRVRGGTVGMVFQEPSSALNPVFSVGFQLAETIRAHRGTSRSSARAESAELLAAVGLEPPVAHLRAYPHQLSGGQQQRVMLALALAGDPDILVADEPTTALDLTTQAQILDLLLATVAYRGMALLLITHDLAVVAATVTRVLVMYAGEVVEEAPATELFSAPRHPYTRALLAAARRDRPEAPPGDLPAPGAWPAGCRFEARCPEARPECRRGHPELLSSGSDRRVRCPWNPPGEPS